MKKNYIRVQTIKKRPAKDKADKEARIIALAEKLHIKIETGEPKIDDKGSNKN